MRCLPLAFAWPSSPRLKVVARNAKDVAVSLWKHSTAIPAHAYSGPWEDFFERFLAGNVCEGSWFDHVVGWWGAAAGRTEQVFWLPFEVGLVVISGLELRSPVLTLFRHSIDFHETRGLPATFHCLLVPAASHACVDCIALACLAVPACLAVQRGSLSGAEGGPGPLDRPLGRLSRHRRVARGETLC